MLSREKINELALQAVEAVSVKIPDNTRWWMPEHYDQEFARLIMQEVESHSVKPLSTSLRFEIIENWFAEEVLQDKALGLLWDYDSMIGIRKEGE